MDYKGALRGFNVYVRNLWDWIQSVVREPNLTPHWQWDACRMHKWDRAAWQPYWEDPWTSSDMWDAQVCEQHD